VVVGVGVVLVIISRTLDRFADLFHITIALLISLLPVPLVVMLKPSAFRPDFVYGVLPYILLAAALSIDALVRISFHSHFITAMRVVLVAIIVLSTLPTFVSNLLIDKDRLPHKAAAAEIAGIPGIKVFAPNPNYFNYYLGPGRVVDIRKANQDYNNSGTDEYFYIPVRKGMTTQFFYDFNSIARMNLVRIIGKDRIDHRSNKIYVFRRNAAASRE
jgi:hypothetical protein